MTTLNKINKAQELNNELENSLILYEMVWWKIAEAIYNLTKDNTFKYVYGSDDVRNYTQKQFYAEKDLSPSTARQKAETYRLWCVKLGYDIKDLIQYNHSKLARARYEKYNIDESNANEVLERALPIKSGGLSFSDFEKWLDETLIK